MFQKRACSAANGTPQYVEHCYTVAMSNRLNRRAASNAFAQGETHIRTDSALSFQGDVAFSYAEPIAVRVGKVLFKTAARFSMTTSHHVGYVSGAWAVTHQITDYNMSDRKAGTIGRNQETGAEIRWVDHGEIRQMARERGLLGHAPWGRQYDAA
jgi:hypothetical protein